MEIDKKIEEEAIDYTQDGYNNYNSETQEIIEDAFKSGAHWAIDELLKELWHDASEEPNPKLNVWIVLQSGEDSWEIVKYGGYNKDGGQTWQREAEKGHILRWCYLSDIFAAREEKEATMFKAGWAMIIFSVLLGIGWAIYNLWQAGNIDLVVAIICAVLFVVGLVMIMTSKDFGL